MNLLTRSALVLVMGSVLSLAACSVELTSSKSRSIAINERTGTFTLTCAGHTAKITDLVLTVEGRPFGPVEYGDEVRLDATDDGGIVVHVNDVIRSP